VSERKPETGDREGRNPIISTGTQKKSSQLFIENRIKYNETKQIVVY